MDQHQSRPSASGQESVQRADSSGAASQAPNSRTRYFRSQNQQSGRQAQYQSRDDRHSAGHQNQYGASEGRPTHNQPHRHKNQNQTVERSYAGDWNSRDIRPNRPQSRPQSRPVPPHGNQTDGSARYSRPNQETSESSEKGQSEDISSFNIVKEVSGDLFEMDPEYALAHCVGSDFIMSSGVAVKFRKAFRSIPELLDQNKKPGEVAFVNVEGRYVYYLVTKLASTGKPLWNDFEKSVEEWKKLCVKHEVKKIAIPKIGCGRDQLDWAKVKNLLNRQFGETGIELTVCIIAHESTPEKKWNLTLQHAKTPLSQLNPVECALVFIGSEDRFLTPSINRLAVKHGFTSDYTAKQLSKGSLYHFRNINGTVNIFGLVVKEKHGDPVSFCAIGKCFLELRKAVKKSKLWYMGFEAFDDPRFKNVTRKVWTMVIDAFFVDKIEVHFCWPEDVAEDCWEERETSH